MILPLLLFLLKLQGDAIIGRWEGTSTCVKTSSNSACHDEVARYDFIRMPGRGDTITVQAYKRVGGAWESMGDIDGTYDTSRHRWVGVFSNGRVHIEWSYWSAGNELRGELVDLPDRRKSRDVVAHRVAGP